MSAGPSKSFRVEGIDHVALTASNVAQSVAWYQKVLGLERRYEDVWGDYPAIVSAGTTSLAIFPVKETKGDTGSIPAIAMRHIAFRVDRPTFDSAREHLEACGLAPTFEDHTAAHSLYFADPDGHRLEITTYEIPEP